MAGFPTYPQAYGIDAAGSDTYTTIVTPSVYDYNHMYVSVQGTNDAIISMDGGVTDHFYIPAGTVILFDSLKMDDGVAIQAKNASAGSNYTSLAITIW